MNRYSKKDRKKYSVLFNADGSRKLRNAVIENLIEGAIDEKLKIEPYVNPKYSFKRMYLIYLSLLNKKDPAPLTDLSIGEDKLWSVYYGKY